MASHSNYFSSKCSPNLFLISDYPLPLGHPCSVKKAKEKLKFILYDIFPSTIALLLKYLNMHNSLQCVCAVSYSRYF